MYRTFSVSNFRCLEQLRLEGLERLNLIAGLNNVGKTALLEALFLHCGAYNPALTLRLSAFRGIELTKVVFPSRTETPWDYLFHGLDTTRAIELAGDGPTGRRTLRLKVLREPDELREVADLIRRDRSAGEAAQLERGAPDGLMTSAEVPMVVRLDYEQGEERGIACMSVDPSGIHTQPALLPPPFPAFFQGARLRVPPKQDAERFGALEVHGKQEVLLKVLRLIEPRLVRVTTVVVGGEPMLHGDVGMGRLVPVPLMGEGMARLATLVLHVANAPDGVVLVDEIENGLHHSMLPRAWRALDEVAREFNTQVFATTHSYECIVAAHKALASSELFEPSFRLHRLQRSDGAIRAVSYDRETLAAAVEVGVEVR